ncbi:Maf1 regulator domain containing protein [Amanita muscaria]
MKYLEVPALSQLAETLTHEGTECCVYTRMEAYSCKNVKRDKKLFKSLEDAYKDEVSNSPPVPSWLALEREAESTPFGPIDKHASRKTLYLLIATLNVAFPDHDFSDVRPHHFCKEKNGASVLNALSNTLASNGRMTMTVPRTYSSYPPTSSDFFPSSVPSSSSPYNRPIVSPLAPPPIISGTHPALFRLIDEVVGLPDCEVYSYTPEIEADPHAHDFSDEEDDVATDEDEESSTDEELAFAFDDYDVDEAPMAKSSSSSFRISQSPEEETFMYSRMKKRGALLWSSHWFFLNRKLKRILFISVWARSKGIGRSWMDEQFGDLQSERFIGWEGGVGAGARALGLTAA